jgi:DNA-binding MarR family transcriptional regulator
MPAAKPDTTTPKPSARLPVDSSVFFKLVRVVNLTAQPFHESVSREHHLSLNDWRVMVVIASHPGCAATDVVGYSGLDKMSVSRALVSLVRAKRVMRASDPLDARRQLLRLSPGGMQLFKRIGTAAMEREAQLFKGLSKSELAALDATLDKLTQALSA